MSKDNQPQAYRLPGHVRPRRYDVRLDARLGREAVPGQVSIQLDLLETTDRIELHARDMQLTSARLQANGQEWTARIALRSESESVALSFPERVPAGGATLVIDFDARVGQNLRGLYLAQDGPERLLCTQCASTDARAVFPCFDEPAFKARFAFEVTTAAEATVLANGPLVSVKDSGDGRTWTFGPTPPMSSYLAALVIGDVAGYPAETVDGIPLQVWSLKGKEHMGAFAHAYTRRLLPWYQDYFGVPYPYQKYDQVAVPGFSFGAMENSGLVLFRQNLLLLDRRTASWAQEKAAASVIAHEFAHMWFGNLVTMEWWDDLWLNEAFAEWMAHRVVHELSPDYRIWDDFQFARGRALVTDALESTHPVYTPVATPAEAVELFDNITYQKGCAVLRMLENYLGVDAFRAGLRTYMQAFGERNARGADLWQHLQAASQEPVVQIMESWILQPGFPCVRVALEEVPEASVQRLRLSQQRFFAKPNAPAGNIQRWWVPLVIRYEDQAGPHSLRHLLAGDETVIELPTSGRLRWVYANADEIGFYRQHHSPDLLERLLAHRDRLTPSERLSLLGDQWALTRSGAQEIGGFLDTLTVLAATEEYHLTQAVAGHLLDLDRILEEFDDPEATARFRNWVRRLFAGQLAALGYEPHAGERQDAAQRRAAILGALTRQAHDPQVVAEAERWAAREAQDPAAVDPNLAGVFVAAVAHFGGAERFETFARLYQERRAAGMAPQVTNRYLAAFHLFRPPDLVERALGLIDQGVIPQENVGPVLARMLAEPHSQQMAWSYLKANWPVIQNLGLNWVGAIVESAGQLPIQLRPDFIAFCQANLQGSAQMSYARALENMDQMVEFKARIRAGLLDWLRRRSAG